MCQAMDQNKNGAGPPSTEKNVSPKDLPLVRLFREWTGVQALAARHAPDTPARFRRPRVSDVQGREALKQLKGSRSGSGSGSSSGKDLTAPTVVENPSLRLASSFRPVSVRGRGHGQDIEPEISNRFRSCSFSARSLPAQPRGATGDDAASGRYSRDRDHGIVVVEPIDVAGGIWVICLEDRVAVQL